MVSVTGCQGPLRGLRTPARKVLGVSQSQFSGAISINMTPVGLRAIIMCGMQRHGANRDMKPVVPIVNKRCWGYLRIFITQR